MESRVPIDVTQEDEEDDGAPSNEDQPQGQDEQPQEPAQSRRRRRRRGNANGTAASAGYHVTVTAGNLAGAGQLAEARYNLRSNALHYQNLAQQVLRNLRPGRV